MMRVSAGLLVFLLVTAILVAGAGAQTVDPASPPAQVRELLKLLGEPAVRDWLNEESKKLPTAQSQASAAERPAQLAAERLALARGRLNRLGAVVPRLPDEARRAAALLGEELQNHNPLGIVVLIFGFALLGLGAEWAFRRGTRRARERAEHALYDSVAHRLRATGVRFAFGLTSVAVFALGSIGAFLVFEWPPLLKEIVLAYLVAAVAWRVAVLFGRLLLEPRILDDMHAARYRLVPMPDEAAAFWHMRLRLFAGWFAFGWATCEVLATLGFSQDAQRLVALTLGLGLLAVAIEAMWRRPRVHRALHDEPAVRRNREALDWLLIAYLIFIWLLWVIGAWGLFAIAIVALLLPVAFSVMNRSASHFLRPANDDVIPAQSASLTAVYVERGLRALIILAASLFLVRFWEVDLLQLTGRETPLTRFVRGALSAIIILLIADLAWQVMKALINRRLATAYGATKLEGEAAARESRLRTLLPIFRNIAFVALAVVAVMMALSAVGVEIGPLIAGAGVLGVAVGFGAQTLVRDVISGIFYLLDDAFRVGEYIQSGNYMGTVESFSLRSVKLRHHRGPVYTVPFGQLGAVQNMSRDWVIDKMTIGVAYNADIDKAKKLVKDIGKELAADPEFAANVIEPLKMQGVEQFGDYAIKLRLKMMTKPNEQFVMRRRALAMIKKAFDENGIEFAFPTVQVAGGGAAERGAAAGQVLARGEPEAGAKENLP
jgi:moderate conductance mechanosensitive channel